MSPFFHQCERGLGGALKAGCPAQRDRYVSFSVWRFIINLYWLVEGQKKRDHQHAI